MFKFLIGYVEVTQAVFMVEVCVCVCIDVVYTFQAVQDFGSICQERDAEDVKGVLPYWPRIYCKISVVIMSFTTCSLTYLLVFFCSSVTLFLTFWKWCIFNRNGDRRWSLVWNFDSQNPELIHFDLIRFNTIWFLILILQKVLLNISSISLSFKITGWIVNTFQ